MTASVCAPAGMAKRCVEGFGHRLT